jgi:hypothetical protein
MKLTRSRPPIFCKFNHNVPRDVINELANNKYDIIIDPLFDIRAVHRLPFPTNKSQINKWVRLWLRLSITPTLLILTPGCT